MASVAHSFQVEEEPGAELRQAVDNLDDLLEILETSVVGRLDRNADRIDEQAKTIAELRAALEEERRIRREAASNLDQVVRIIRDLCDD